MLYADDAKLYVIYPAGSWTPALQLALVVLEKWSLKWGLRLAIPKCQILMLGRLNHRHNYTLFGVQLETVSVIRDLGVMISEDLSWFPHISSIVAKAAKRANAILRSFTYSDFELLGRAYITYVRPLLESASSVWCPFLEQEKHLLESVQRRYSKRLFWKCKLLPTSYENRLAVLKWPTLEQRRNRADLILTYNILKGHTEGAATLVSTRENLFNLRGNELRLQGYLARLNLRKNFFSHRIVDKWNTLKVDFAKIRSEKAFREYLTGIGY
ncbi:hypothetical protein [Pseudoalteromonas sp.]|uniref:hypothetical protein n=1 Tax=Pseudoalteromonas sp. TaxID=53249 RepID=UPI00345CFCA1|nr:hypothetical protein [Pseudoalteromonas sp.]